LFHRAKSNRVFEDVIEQIEAAIVGGNLEPGDKLPPERRILATFQVSRGTFREALRVLEQKGLIEIRTGVKGGAFVRSLSTDQVRDSLGLLIQTRRISLPHLAEFRQGVEGLAARLAAGRAGPKGIREIKCLLEKARDLAGQGAERWDEYFELETRLHKTLARLGGNPLYELTLLTVHDNIRAYYDLYLPKDDQRIAEAWRDWAGIVEAMERGEAEETGRLVEDHVRRFMSYMEPVRDQDGGKERS